MWLLLTCDLLKVVADKSVINVTLTCLHEPLSVFTDKISWSFEPRDSIQEEDYLPAVKEDQVRAALRNFDTYMSMGLDGKYLEHKESWLI